MDDSTPAAASAAVKARGTSQTISIVQRGSLKTLEVTLRKQWRLGQNIVLCWSSDERGVLVIFVPHYFLGNYCAQSGPVSADGMDNESFIRGLISGRRHKSRDELFAIAKRLGVSPSFVKLSTALSAERSVLDSVEQLIKRYGLSFVNSRAVLLFDIAEFSLHTPFEQASQLNSLSYSLNSAYNKLLAQGIEINFARTTTGDGYYVWNRDLGPNDSQDLFYFMLLVIADNAVAQAASRGSTVPTIRSAFHTGSHYELYQAEGVNPTVFSYIVGDVTIQLARMVDMAAPHQILVGDFQCSLSADREAGGPQAALVGTPEFVKICDGELASVLGTQLSGKAIVAMHCELTGAQDTGPDHEARRFRITDKHGIAHYAYNLEIGIDLDGESLSLGLDASHLPRRVGAVREPVRAEGAATQAVAGAPKAPDDQALSLPNRRPKTMTED